MSSFPFLVIAILFSAWLLCRLLKYSLGIVQRRYAEKRRILISTLAAVLYRPLSIFIWLAALLLAGDQISFAILGPHAFDMPLFLNIALAVTLGWILLKWKSRWISEMHHLSDEHKVGWTSSQLDLVSKMATVVILFVIGLLLLEATGMNVTTLIAFGGVGGLALAFASQQVISNFFGGLMVYFTQPFSVREWVEIPEHNIEGHIEEIGWYMTRIRGMDKRPIYVPNSVFTQAYVITPSRMSHQRLKETLSLRHKDLTLVPKLVEEIQESLKNNPKIDQHQKNKVYLLSLGSTTFELEFKIYIPECFYPEYEYIRQDILLDIARIVQKSGARFANKQQIILTSDSDE